MAEFDSPRTVARRRRRRFATPATRRPTRISPFPIHGMAEALGFKERAVAPIVLAGGLAGLIGGYGLEYWTQVIAYPMNIGGRPFHAWVSFIPPAFETTILFAAFAAVFGMLALNGLPQPYHPVFNGQRFAWLARTSSSSRSKRAIRSSMPRPRAISWPVSARERWWRLRTEGQAQGTRPKAPARNVLARVLTMGLGPRAFGLVAAAVLSSGCRQDMHDAPRYDPLEASTVFPKGSSAQPLVRARCARGQFSRRRAAAHRQGRRRSRPTTFPFADHARRSRPRRGALQHLLLALPRPHRRRQRHGRAARLPAGGVVSHRSAAPGARPATSSTS